MSPPESLTRRPLKQIHMYVTTNEVFTFLTEYNQKGQITTNMAI